MLFSNICTRTNFVQSTLISEGVKYRQNDESPKYQNTRPLCVGVFYSLCSQTDKAAEF